MYSIVSCRNYTNRKEVVVETSKNLDDILELLKIDKYYHSITSKDENSDYMLFFDIDGNEYAEEDKKTIEVDIHDFIAKMKSYINKTYHFNLTEDDFCYTQNNNNKYKFHVTVPSIFATVEQQKKICINFVKEYKQYKTIYDSTVYSLNRLFRLPNQSKGIKDGKDYGIHIIKRGNMKDFILENIGDIYLMDNIPDDDLEESQQKQDPEYNSEQEDSEEDDDEIDDSEDEEEEDSQDNDITNILESFPYDKYYTGRRSWLYFIGLLKSAGLSWEIACKYSQNMQGHDPCTCEKVFNSLTKVYSEPVQKIKNIIVKYNNIKYIKQSGFNFRVKYDILDFKKEFNNTKYESYKEIKDVLGEKLMSVCAYIIDLECFVIKSNGNLKNIKRITNCMPKVWKKSGDKYERFNIQNYVIESIFLNYNSVDYILNDYKDNRIFNIWKGYDAIEIDDPDSEVINVALDLLSNVFCGGDNNLLRYVLTWFSNIVSTGEMNKVALVLVSDKQGTGKGTFLELMAKILGKHCFKAISGIGPVTQKHNTCLQGIRLLVMNEAASTRDEFRSNFDKLKAIITDPTVEIEPKGFASYEATNIGNYIIVSNHRDSVVIENNDRRYQVLECSDKYANDTEYFARVRRVLQLGNDYKGKMDAANSFYTYLMNYKDKVDLFKIVNTPLREEMKERSLPNSVKFVKEYQEKLDSLESNLGMEHLYKMRASELYQKYKDWAITNGEKVMTNTKFGTDITNVVDKMRKNDGSYYVFKKNE